MTCEMNRFYRRIRATVPQFHLSEEQHCQTGKKMFGYKFWFNFFVLRKNRKLISFLWLFPTCSPTWPQSDSSLDFTGTFVILYTSFIFKQRINYLLLCSADYHTQLLTQRFPCMNLEALHRGKQTLQPHFTDKGAKAQTRKAWFSKEWTFPAPFKFSGEKSTFHAWIQGPLWFLQK